MQTYTTDPRPAVVAASDARVMWSWSAIAAGTLTSLIIQVMLTMLGIGVGLIATDVPTANNAPVAVSTAAVLSFIASGIFSAFVGGAVAGALSPSLSDRGRSSHALATWALATLIVVGATMLTAAGGATVAGQLAGPYVNANARLTNMQTVRPNVTPPPRLSWKPRARPPLRRCSRASLGWCLAPSSPSWAGAGRTKSAIISRIADATHPREPGRDLRPGSLFLPAR